jgi:DNA-binding MarR family transcriptional regulator
MKHDQSTKEPASREPAKSSPAEEAAEETLDHESRLHEGDHEALRLWLRLLTCTNLIEGQIRADLRSDFACTLPRFDLMAQLYRHPNGLKMGELSRRLMVTGGNVTGIADQLVKEGQVQRETDANDRRAFLVKLTPSGRKAFARMAAQHEQWVVGLLGGLSETERHTLYELLGRLKTTLKETNA